MAHWSPHRGVGTSWNSGPVQRILLATQDRYTETGNNIDVLPDYFIDDYSVDWDADSIFYLPNEETPPPAVMLTPESDGSELLENGETPWMTQASHDVERSTQLQMETKIRGNNGGASSEIVTARSVRRVGEQKGLSHGTHGQTSNTRVGHLHRP